MLGMLDGACVMVQVVLKTVWCRLPSVRVVMNDRWCTYCGVDGVLYSW